jgi:hypothetical protein
VVSLVSTPQPGGPGPYIYVLQWQGGPVISPDMRFTFRRFLRLAELLWRYSNLPPRRRPHYNELYNKNNIFNILCNSCRGRAVFVRIMVRYCGCPLLQGTHELRVAQIWWCELRNISTGKSEVVFMPTHHVVKMYMRSRGEAPSTVNIQPHAPATLLSGN